MKKDRYRLESVLDERRRAKDSAIGRLVEQRENLSRAEADLELRQHAVANCREQTRLTVMKMSEQANRGIAAGRLVEYRAQLSDLREREDQLRRQVEQQRDVVRRAEAAVEQARHALTAAAQDERVIEKHRESWAANLRREENKREQKTLDEVGINLPRNRF